MERENFFILLELPFAPMENDADKINAKINTKRQEWSRDGNSPNFQKKDKAGRCLAMLDEIKKVMLDPALRKKEAEEAQKIKKLQQKELEKSLQLYAVKLDELSPKEIKNLLKKFGAYGFNENDIKNAFKEIKKRDKDVTVGETIDKMQATNITKSLAGIGMEGKNLYEFLGMSQSSQCQALCEKAENLIKQILAKGTKTAEDNAKQRLCGICKDIFKDKLSKNKYDNYVAITKYYKLNNYIDEAAKSSKNTIDNKIKNTLIDMAIQEHKIGLSQASNYISNYCNFMGYKEQSDTIICQSCNTENPASATNCSKCGKILTLVCPLCESKFGNATVKCTCGFDFSSMDKAVEIIKDAKKLWLDRKNAEAEEKLKQAKMLWSNHPDVVSLENEITQFKNKFKNIMSDIMSDISSKAFYSAELKISQAKRDGFTIEPSVNEKVSNAIQNTEKKLSEIKNADADKAFNTLISLSEEISDSNEVKTLLAKYPPATPSQITFERAKNEFTFSWMASSSTGNIEYQLVRKENTFPNSPDDGVVIYKGGNLSFTDSKLDTSVVYCYAVFAVRAGILSKPAMVKEKIIVVENVSAIKTRGADGMINISWSRPASVKEVKIWICESESQPSTNDKYTQIPCNRLDGISIKDLKNNTRYWIRIAAYHTINGEAFSSDYVYVNAVPQKPAEPISNFRVSPAGEKYKAEWDSAEWDIILFYSLKKPDITEGIPYDYSDVEQMFTKIGSYSLITQTSAEFTINFTGECYIIPAQINAQNVILNSPIYISSVPPAKDLSFDINSSRTELYVNFTWPKKINRSLMVYRTDTYPTGPDDELAVKIECNKRQYESNEGILIANPPEGRYYTHIYTYFESDENRVYSSPSSLIINNEPQRDVYYTLQYKKSGLFKKKIQLIVTIKSKGDFIFPKFCIVSKFKSVPLDRNDGDLLCSVKEDTEVPDGVRTFIFDCEELRKDTKMKMFFLNDRQYRYYKIQNDGSNTV